MDETALLRKILSYDRQNFDGDVSRIGDTDPALDFIANVLTDNGISVQFQPYTITDGRSTRTRRNLVAKLCDNPDLPTIGYQGHIDTVPFGNYKGNPLGEQTNGKIYGRGSVDMTGSIACMVFAMIQANNMKNRYANPVLIVTSDEEANGFAGINRYLEDKPALDFAICGEASLMTVYDRFKGALCYNLEIDGTSGHSSRYFEHKHAIYRGLPVLNALAQLATNIQAFTNQDFAERHGHAHRSTMSIGVIRAGTKVNMVPDKLAVEFEMRLVNPASEYKKIIEKTLEPFKDVIARRECKFALDPIFSKIDSSNPFYSRLNMLSEHRGVMFGFAEANIMNRYGIPTIVYGVGNPAMAHTCQEFVEIGDLKKHTQKLVDFLK